LTIHHTTNYGIAYIDDLTPLKLLGATSQEVAESLDAALGRGGITPPDVTTFAALAARVTAVEGRPLGDYTLGDASIVPAGQVLLTGSPGWSDLLTVTATSAGRPVRIRFDATAFNGASGADRTVDYRVICITGGTTDDRGGPSAVPVLLTGAPRRSSYRQYSHTPAAGSHTWKLQGRCSAASSCYVEEAALVVIEKGHA